MCGIAGFVDRGHRPCDPRVSLRLMGAQLAHRGPDDSGLWWDETRRVGFSHRRLSIIERSLAGHQPMASVSGRFMLVFNGEIYNAPALRDELTRCGAAPWRGRSDTEVMLCAFEAWGVIAATKRFDGMFAFAVCDLTANTLHLIRDRVGKKPLYYGWIGTTFAFASELDALRAMPGASLDVDRDALAAMLRFGHVPAPRSIYHGISKVLPGQSLSLPLPSGLTRGTPPRAETYWSAAAVADSGVDNPITDSSAALVAQFEGHLERAVRARMISDVPLGAFLSGGIDSALVVAMMTRASSKPVETFTIGFEHRKFDESQQALEVARAFHTNHHPLRVTARDALSVATTLGEMYDEPFADSSQIPTAMLSVLARSRVTVALSGDGGDEVMGGYDRYVYAPQLWKVLHRVPLALRRLLAFVVREKVATPRVERLAALLTQPSFDGAYRALASTSERCEGLVLGASNDGWTGDESLFSRHLTDLTAQMMQRDLVTYLVDDILVKVDRASMAVGLEVRSPLLDHQLVEWAWRVPILQKVGPSSGKLLSRALAARVLPKSLARRPKKGFGVPLALWLRKEFRPWAEELLAHDRLVRDGFLDAKPARALWQSFLRGDTRHQNLVWAILMFQSWLGARQSARG